MCVLNGSSEIVAEEVLPNTRECLAAYAARYPRATFIMETGTHSPWVSCLLEQQGHRVLVANARKLTDALCVWRERSAEPTRAWLARPRLLAVR